MAEAAVHKVRLKPSGPSLPPAVGVLARVEAGIVILQLHNLDLFLLRRHRDLFW